VNLRNCGATPVAFAFLLIALPLSAGEPDWWRDEKARCGLAPDLAWNDWDGQCPNDSNHQVAATDVRKVAFQRAIQRYNALVRSLPDDEREPWLDAAGSTEEEFFKTVNQVHRHLVNRAADRRRTSEHLLTELPRLQQIIATYPASTADIRTETNGMGLEYFRLDVALAAERQRLELTQRAATQLEARTFDYEGRIERDKETILDSCAVLLPPGMISGMKPGPYQSLPRWTGSVLQRERDETSPEPIVITATVPIEAVKARRVDAVPPLIGTAEEAVAQLEADAQAAGAASHDADVVWDAVKPRRAVAAQLDREQQDAMRARAAQRTELKTIRGQLDATKWALLLAGDDLQGVEQSFVYRAAEAWIWQNVKKMAIRQAKVEARGLVAAGTMGVPYRDMTEAEMLAFFNAGNRNIFGISDRALSAKESFYPVVERVRILQTHGLDNVVEAVHLISEGSPREIDEFIDGMFKEMDDDCQQLVKASLGAIHVPEPFETIYARYLLKP
jgi:hypothetical protein